MVERLTGVLVAIPDLPEEAPRTRRQHVLPRLHPVLGPLLMFIELGQGEQAHPRHRIRRPGLSGDQARLTRHDLKIVGADVTLSVSAPCPLNQHAGPHHPRIEVVPLLLRPGLDRGRPGRHHAQDLRARRPQRPVGARTGEQVPHCDPPPGPHLLDRHAQRVVEPGRVVNRVELVRAGHRVLTSRRTSLRQGIGEVRCRCRPCARMLLGNASTETSSRGITRAERAAGSWEGSLAPRGEDPPERGEERPFGPMPRRLAPVTGPE